MEPTKKTTTSSACSCKTSTEKRIVYWIRKAALFTIRPIVLIGLFMLSTSYQGHRKELLLMEHEMYIPALKDIMTDFFRQTSDLSSHLVNNSSLRTLPLLKEFYSKQNYRPVRA